MKLTLTAAPALPASATCTTLGSGHRVDPHREVFAARSVDWSDARVLQAVGTLLLVDVDGEARWFGQHDAESVALAAKYADTVRFHAGFDLLEVGGWMFSVLPMAEHHTTQLPDCS